MVDDSTNINKTNNATPHPTSVKTKKGHDVFIGMALDSQKRGGGSKM